VILAVGAGVGLLDEGIKIFLPTRGFDVVDLAKDCIIGSLHRTDKELHRLQSQMEESAEE
jgi:VanZ family protein